MVALLLCAYATKQRSSRAIERHCRQDVAYRVITGNLIPDHATIARFVDRHERALADLFGEVLRLCDRAGLVKFEAFKGPDGKPTTASNAAFGFAPVHSLGQSSGASGLFGESFDANYGEAAEFEYTS